MESKKSEEIKYFMYAEMTNDLNMGPLPRWPLTKTGNSLIWVNEPSSLLRYVEQQKEDRSAEAWQDFEQENSKLISFANSITPEDNPYLIVTEIDF